MALRLRGIDIRIPMAAYQQVIAKLPDIAWLGTLPGRAGIRRRRRRAMRRRAATWRADRGRSNQSRV
jgi:hypothetical protein